MDLNMMMRDAARTGLQAQLDKAVTDGDTEAARKAADDIAKLDVSTAPKAAPFNSEDIKTELKKLDWFGVDPKKTAKAMELGKHMDLTKFSSAALFAAAVVKATEDDLKPAAAAGAGEGDEDEDDEDKDDDKGKDEPKPRKTDAPGEGDNTQRTVRRASSGPWTKLADAPPDVQKEIKRTADKFVPAKAPKEQREAYVAKALESQYLIHQRTKGKK